MAIFWNVFIKSIAVFFSFIVILTIILLLVSWSQEKNEKFIYLSGDKNSNNTIALIELNGLIIEKNNKFADLTNSFVISPTVIKSYLETLKILSPNVIIFSINSPGGTVSASKTIYDLIKNFKKNNNIEVIFHSNELLTSGGYWVASAGDEIYASYGSIIGSIGVKGPDWFFYDEPIKISSGIFGNTIDTKKGIKVFTNQAGKSKDILNPYRKPTNYELDHLQSMVDEIYDDFVRIISKERKIEIETLINDIGALIYSSKKAAGIHLIDGVTNVDDLIKKIAKKKKFTDYKIIINYNQKKSLIKEILSGNKVQNNNDKQFECLSLYSSIVSILNYQSTGC